MGGTVAKSDYDSESGSYPSALTGQAPQPGAFSSSAFELSSGDSLLLGGEPKSAFSQPGSGLGLPIVSLDQVRDPQLRQSLSQAEPLSPQQPSYPSAEPTGVLPPLGEQVLKPAPAGRVKSSIKSFVQADQSLTKPMRGLARLSQRQFAFSQQGKARQNYLREKEQAREILNFTLRLAETMFHYGADTVDVDSAIVSICAAYGLDDVEVDITNQSVLINYVSDIDRVDETTRLLNLGSAHAAQEPKEERFSHTVMRVVRSWSDNYAALADIYKLIHDITAQGLSRSKAERRLKKINRAKKAYSPLVLMLANIATASFLTIALGGSLAAALAAGLVFLAIHCVNQLLVRLSMPNFFTMAAGAGVVTFAAIYLSDDTAIFSDLGAQVAAPHIVAAGLIMLLPTSRLVSAVQDALNGFPLTAAGKLVSTGMSFLGIVVGLASAVAVLSVIGTAELHIEDTVFDPPNIWVNYIFMVLASLTIAMTTHARWSTLLWVALISSCGIWAYNLFTMAFGAGADRANTAIAALLIGLVSTYLAYRLHAPAAIFYVPALTFLLPGLSVFRGLYMFTVETNTGAGVPGMISAVAIIVSMASGVVLGSYLMQYFIQRFLLTEQQDYAAGQPLDR